ncbi:MAG TPA: PAS domain S-box protein, partial [Actinomycetota bacterium]|nr:PAS domain S-box protein [Actinomycetota bacterium]
MNHLRAWLRSAGPLLVALPALIVLLSLGGYLLTSRTIANDREEEAEQRAQVVSVRTEGLLGRVRAFSSGLGTALATEPEARQDIFAAAAARWGAASGIADALWVERAGSRLIAAYTKRVSSDVRPGIDVSGWPGLAPELLNRSTTFALRASSLGSLNGEPGFYVVDGASFGGRAGFLALFVPRGWLTSALALDPQEVAIDLDGRRVDGTLDPTPSATTSFESLGRRWGIGVGREPLTGLQTILPWLAVAWPLAAALVAFLIGRAILLRRRAERDVERMFDVTMDAMCVAGIDGYFKRVNPGYARMLGYSQHELLSRPFSDFIHPDDRERANEAMGALVRGEKVVGL